MGWAQNCGGRQQSLQRSGPWEFESSPDLFTFTELYAFSIADQKPESMYRWNGLKCADNNQ